MTPREPDRYDCHECGVGVKVDEDGCCAHCGRDAIEVVDGLPVGPLRDVYHAPPPEPAAPAPDLRRVVERAQVELNRRDARIAELETALVKIRDGCGYGLGNDIPWVRAVAKSALAARASPHAKGEGK